ncbi:MAG TPA: phosphoglycolate phosphatase [Oceanospirillales bacterium]|nr:phosphoglycolate phosphatase [Oceanospirillales bacterium]
MNLSNCSAVFFDLDGTLIDSAKDLHFAVNQMLKDLAMAPTNLENIKNWIGNGTLKLVERALTHTNDNTNPDEITLQKAFNLFSNYYRDCVGEYSTLFPGVKELLVELLKNNTKIACITNKPLEFTEFLLQQNMISQFFSVICAGDNVKHKKPNPWPLIHAAESVNVEIKECIMIGDSQHDIAAAKSAGCQVIAVSYGYNHGQDIRQFNPDFVIDSLTELL